MAVKASNSITLSSVVDVKAVYRYYLLQSSTLSIPSKPTTNPPPNGWDDVEPTYTDGSTMSLYTVDLTVFSDDTWVYSEVSLSSSYEAAKVAYNKAQNAQDTANKAQEDIASVEASFEVEAESIRSKVSSVQDGVEENSDKIVLANSLIEQFAESIKTLVVGANGESLMTQTDSGWQYNIATLLDTVNSHSSKLANYDDYVEITSYEDEPCIRLGERSNDFKVLITNKRILFLEGGSTPTYIFDNTLVTENVEVKQELRQGGWVQEIRDGCLCLVWKGATE